MKICCNIALMVAALGVCGCQMTSAPDAVKSTDIRYFEDSRTKLCFASIASSTYSGYNVVSIANVPCSVSEAVTVELIP